MKPVLIVLFWAIFLAGLQKAMGVKSSSSKRKRSESDTSDDWKTFSLNLHLTNEVPGTIAKKAIEKARKAGARGIQLQGKKGKQNAARTLKRKWPKTLWPSLYWALIPIKCPKNQKEDLG